MANDSATINPGQKVRIAVLGNDLGSINPATLQIVSPPSVGTATIQPSGEILYAHSGGSTAPVSFTYRISSTSGQSQVGTVNVSVSSSLRIPNNDFNVPAEPPPSAVEVVPAYPGASFYLPVCMDSPPGDTKRLFVGEHGGKIKVIRDVTAATPVSSVMLDLVQVITAPARTPAEYWNPVLGDESGLLGFAFHPAFATNGYFYVTYSVRKTSDPAVRFQRLSRFTVPPAQIGQPAPVANPASELILIEQRDRHDWHNGGDLHFGADGYLYYAVGDEGEPGDGYSNAQRIEMNFFSAMLRIDVDKKPGNLEANAHPNPAAIGLGYGPGNSIPRDEIPAGSGKFFARYSVPIDNPYVATSKGGTWNGQFNGIAIPAASLPYVRSEFWAVGFRNPWRFSIDAQTGDIWAGDVGQESYEEVDLVTKGANYGWAYREGLHDGPKNSPPAGFSPVPPIYEFAHPNIPGGESAYKGNCVIGGVVYRGTRFSSLSGSYFFGDYVTGNIWTLKRSGGVPTVTRIAGLASLTAFGTDPSNGDVLVCDYNGSRIMRITTTTVTNNFPATLSATGLFADLTDLSPAPGVMPYTVNLPLWSDYAVKRRWFLMPDVASKINWSRDGAWTFPAGQIWIKHFDLESVRGDPASAKKRIETRLLVKTATSTYGVSYRWNAAGTDATLVGDAGEDVPVNVTVNGAPYTQQWRIPSRSQCSSCHTPQAGHALSFNTRQLNLSYAINGFNGNQIDLLKGHGYFSNTPESPSILPRHFRPDETSQPIEDRVRSYLAVNCSNCHAGTASTVPAAWDGRPEVTLAQTGLINGQARSAGDGYKLIVPGDTAHSVVMKRMMGSAGFSRMPPMGSNEIDNANVSLVANWINQMAPGVNIAPIAVDDTYPASRDTALVIPPGGVLGNDTDSQADPLTSVLATNPGHGTVSLNANGGFTYTPVAGYVGLDSFSYRASDGRLTSNLAIVTISVSGGGTVSDILVNGSFESGYTGWTFTGNQSIESAAPYVATDGGKLVGFNDGNRTPNAVLSQNFSTVAGQTYTLTFDVGVLSYTTASQTLRVTVSGSGTILDQVITFNGPGNGSNLWLPQSFTFVATGPISTLTFRDQSTSTAALDMTLDRVRVTGPPSVGPPIVNTAPVATGNAYSIDENITLVVPAAGVLANDTDADSNPLTAILDVGPGHGNLTLNANGGFIYIPAVGYFGTDSFTYHASDGSSDSNIVTVGLTINENTVVSAPTALADSYQAQAGRGLDVPAPGVLGNDTDPLLRSLTAILDGGPSHGAVTLNANGGFTYTPDNGYTGPDSFTYHSVGGGMASNVVSASLYVNGAIASTLLNGSFETGFTGWTVTGNQSIQATAPYAATDGVKLVGFNGGNSTPNAVLSQSFATVAGQSYTLAFDAGVLSYNTSPQTMRVTVTGTAALLDKTITINGAGGGSNRWLPQSFTFVADGPAATLVFRDQSASTVALDMMLDNVRVSGGASVPNTAPAVTADQYVATQNTPLVVPGPGVLINDTDPEASPLTAVSVSLPSHGSLILNANGGFTYTPAAAYTGPDSFTYQASDGLLRSNIVTVVLTVVQPASGGLVNGSFESDYTGWTRLGNQQIQSNSIAYVSSDGLKHVGFNGGNSTPNGVLSQTFATTPAQLYRLQFDAGVMAYNTNAQRLQVTAAGTSSLLSQAVTISGPGNGSTRWFPQSFTFVANSASTTLTFQDQSSSTNSLDLLLDNVRVTVVTTLASASPAPAPVEVMNQAPAASLTAVPQTESPAAAWLTGTPGDMTVHTTATQPGTYALEYSDDLIRWEKGAERQITAPGFIEFRDIKDPPSPARFYRISHTP